jgi:hypothetical protein
MNFKIIISCIFLFTLNNFVPFTINGVPNVKKDFEVVIVYMGTSSCVVCTNENNTRYFKRIKNNFIKQNVKIRTIGIAFDTSAGVGYEFLQTISTNFDGIIAGGHANNLGGLKYLKGDFRGREFVPQILILLREYEDVNNTIKSGKLLYRLVGLDDNKKFSNLVDQIEINNFIKS